jgi:periplasmic divalent cation tolerance protein
MMIGWTTLSSRDDAEKLAAGAVESGFAACCQVEGPIRSFYRWKGSLEQEEEFRITFKFLAAQAEALEKWLHENHPYEVPEWMAVKAERVSEKYLNWTRNEAS